MITAMKVFGIAGRSGMGKTTLLERLVPELTTRGLVVSLIKHSHKAIEIDRPGKDSYRLREAGCQEVLLMGQDRWALMHELRGEAEPAMADVIARLGPCDLVLVEGYKREAHRKIEARRSASKSNERLSAGDPSIMAVAADHAQPGETLPVFDLDDVTAIADFVERATGLALK